MGYLEGEIRRGVRELAIALEAAGGRQASCGALSRLRGRGEQRNIVGTIYFDPRYMLPF